MLRRMSWRQLVEWAAYYQLEPFGQPARESSRKVLEQKLTAWFGSVVQALYNIFARKPGTPTYPRDRFEIRWSDGALPAGPQYARTPEAQARMSQTLRMIAQAYGRKDGTHGG